MSPKRPTIIAVLGLALLLLTGCYGMVAGPSTDVTAAIDHLSQVIAWGVFAICAWMAITST